MLPERRGDLIGRIAVQTDKDKSQDSPAAEDAAPSPLRMALRILLVIFAVAGVIMAASLLMLLVSNAAGFMRVIVAMVMAVAIAMFGIGYFRQLGNPPPPEPEPVAVDPRLRLAYLCEMCGLELAVVMAAKDKAPKHCGEPMILVRR